ncbi:MAG: hypothetical protein J6O18_05165 [Bacilli bacterium]|nr:hypothetical protein [Bacilli bacterium]
MDKTTSTLVEIEKEQENIRKALFSIDRTLGKIALYLETISKEYEPQEEETQLSWWDILKKEE